jgi:hypothetical protein
MGPSTGGKQPFEHQETHVNVNAPPEYYVEISKSHLVGGEVYRIELKTK